MVLFTILPGNCTDGDIVTPMPERDLVETGKNREQIAQQVERFKKDD
jgi:hypothetical protein